MKKSTLNINHFGSAITSLMIALLFFSACRPSHKEEVDRLNNLSYAYHYRNLDSAKVYAEKALRLSDDYGIGYAEAYNNLAFVEMAKMNYQAAQKWLDLVEEKSNNQLELLIADVQHMRICQRESHNKDFYTYRERAMARLRRLNEEAANLPARERRRAIYAQSEFDIVDATYFYYVGLDEPMMKALNDIDADALENDTAQYLNYLYNFGSGGAITKGTAQQIAQTEFDYLVQCYMLASTGSGYPYWQANALQAISEHLQRPAIRDFLIKNNLPAIQYLNSEQMPDSLLAGNLAQRALNIFLSYGDVYQIAGAYRTLAECYFAIKDYNMAGNCLIKALETNKEVEKAPDLVASIYERLCMVYSALNDKQKSDYNRNIYLDLQEQTRQDRQLEARAALLDENALQLNAMIVAVIAMIVLVVFLLYIFDRMRRRKIQANPVTNLLEPLKEWKQRNEQHVNEINDEYEELDEELQMARLHLSDNKRRNLEQRAKVSLVNSITPFIDRMIHEVDRLVEGKDSDEVKQERYQYIAELTDKINQYNQILTEWIQMRQGALSLRIVSFPLQPLFDIVQKGKMGFLMKGIQLDVQPTTAQVKADRTLTLFMINTIADNARKFTPEGGKVMVSAEVLENCVEVSIADTGKGMDEEQLAHVFDRTYTGGHGFGLLNCKGIIEKYKKVSSIFSVCQITCESEVGKGSVFRFRLPKGVSRVLAAMVFFMGATLGASSQKASSLQHSHQPNVNLSSADLQRADDFADSAYFSNIAGTYARTLAFADSSIYYLNRHYLSLHPGGKCLMVRNPNVADAAEIKWFEDSVKTNYNVILDLRNESAVAALALHKWQLYNSNNKVYTQLFRERSADSTLPDYVRTMQTSENSKMVAIILLSLLLLQLPIAYYLLYYRHVVRYRYAVERINAINQLLLSDLDVSEKMKRIKEMWAKKSVTSHVWERLDGVVEEIEAELQRAQEVSAGKLADKQMLEDEIHRVKYENDKLHVSNLVLDNCLSTLKHETMYYPSRIRQLIATDADDVLSLQELVGYYKELYTMLSAQAMEIVEEYIRYDREMLPHLLSLLRKATGEKKFVWEEEHLSDGPAPAVPVSDGLASAAVTAQDGQMTFANHQIKGSRDSVNSHYIIRLADTKFTAEECRLLFTPLTRNLDFLLCRQIVREIGEVTNRRGSGIQAELSEDGMVIIRIVLPKNMLK